MTTSTLRVVATSDDQPGWLAARRRGCTATDVAKIGGNAGRATLQRALDGKREDIAQWTGNKYTRHGNDREPKILAWVGQASASGAFGSGKLIASHDLYAHVDDDRYLATPDGRSEDWEFFRELVEVKTTVKDWASIPADYLRQIAWQQFVTGADRTLFVWEVHEDFQPVDLEPKWQWVKRDQPLIDELRAKADLLLRFMAGEFPVPDPVADDLITRYLLQREVADSEAEKLKAIEAEVRAWIGDRTKAQVLGTLGDLSFTTSTSRRLSSTSLKKDHPDLWEAYATDTPTSRLTITPLRPAAPEEAQEAAA